MTAIAEIEARAKAILRARPGADATHTEAEWLDAIEQAERELLTTRAVAVRDAGTIDGIDRS